MATNETVVTNLMTENSSVTCGLCRGQLCCTTSLDAPKTGWRTQLNSASETAQLHPPLDPPLFSYILRCSPVAYIILSHSSAVFSYMFLVLCSTPVLPVLPTLRTPWVCQMLPRISCWRLLGWHVATPATVGGSEESAMTWSLPGVVGFFTGGITYGYKVI